MDHRVGLCSSCGASFKLPASFSAARAKCKVCGGVVEVGPVRSDAGTGSVPPPPPPKKKREGPSMKEQLLAKRQAAAESQPPESSISGVPGRTVDRSGTEAGSNPMHIAPGASTRGVAGVPTGKVARGAKKPVAGAAARTSGTGGTERGISTSGRTPKAPAAAAGGAAAAARGSRRTGPASSRRRGRAGDVEEGGEAGARPGRRPKKKQSPALLGITVGLVLIAAVAVGWFLMTNRADDSPEQPDTAGIPVTAPEAPAAPEGNLPEETPAGTGAEPTAPEAPSSPEGAAAEQGAAERAPAAARTIDLAAIEPFGPDEGTDEAEWQRIRGLVATALDFDSGIAGGRARQELEALGRPAVPAIINAMLRLDYTTERGYQDGDVAQRMLREISNGKNFEWRYTTDPKDVYYNQRVVQMWWEVWNKAKDDRNYWLVFTKQTADQVPEPGAGEAIDGIKIDDDDLDALDDL